MAVLTNPRVNEVPAPKGNKFWMRRSSHGLRPMFDNPDQLWSACVEYFEWVQATPLFEAKAFAYKGEVTITQLPRMRAMTIEGLCIFLDIHKSTWIAYRNREAFKDVVARVDAIIRTQKFEGAAAKLLNGKIITRDLGLADKQELATRVDDTRDGLKSKPLDERVHAIGYYLYTLIVEAELNDDTKAHDKALGWINECVKALKGETHFGVPLKDAYSGEKK